MPEMKCFEQCVVVEPIELSTISPPRPTVNGGGSGGGGINSVVTSGTDDVVFTGDGTEASPLRARFVPDRQIEFEIAIGKLSGALDGETIGIYISAKEASFPAGLSGSRFAVDDQENDVLINIVKNGLALGAISIVGGVPNTASIPAFNLIEGDRLEFISAVTSEFSVLALTILGLRTLEYVA